MSSKPVFLNQFKHNTLSGVLFIGVIMDEKAKKRLIHIRDATEVNKQHAEDYKRTSVERHRRAKAQKKKEFYDNRSINYRKHIRW